MYLPKSVRMLKALLAPFFKKRATKVTTSWERRPNICTGDLVCVFVTYAPNGVIPAHSLFHAKAWSEAGFKVVITVIVDESSGFTVGTAADFAAGLCIRLNEGYDFGAWAAAIAQMPEIRSASLLAIANDSVYGPLDTFPAMLERVFLSRADVIGLTESYEIKHHIQSYMVFFRSAALQSEVFWKFWKSVKVGRRGFVIQHYEVNLMSKMESGGLTTAVLFPITNEICNPTLKYWRQLVELGLPFVKIQLLRDNSANHDLAGWDEVLAGRGFDVGLVRDHLGPEHPVWSRLQQHAPDQAR